ncbi:2Fe-2S iron-sulfur cluster-binding protein [Cupriavidus sp. L7L]|uniref:2Fe-2S iron-sulfur cluster-binding protein n=1 Tax=Cupriavidus sp. L7L TaxID=2546443 RepID=UPI001055D0EF|nr:2Fe-2S iron-sulfur cluster-binding protein [Cupriavidus sp. L7L]TDF67225.1 2Fe-2S iron-sulfur cluster binding domain-containing protein [Cupriavidus sp. L7L]
MLSLTIDGKVLSVPSGQSVLEAARLHGIEIPTLCHHRDLTPVGSCRLCLVEIEGEDHFAAACALEARAGMVVRTATPRIVQARRAVLEMLLLRYDDAAQPERDSEFMRWVREYGASRPEAPPTAARFTADTDPHPFIRVDLNKCILCTRCVRACAEVQGRAPAGPHAGWDYTGPDDILTEVGMLCPSYAGITPARLSRGEALHWPRTQAIREHPSCTWDTSAAAKGNSTLPNTYPLKNCRTQTIRCCSPPAACSHTGTRAR